jgi:hypothetical protein
MPPFKPFQTSIFASNKKPTNLAVAGLCPKFREGIKIGHEITIGAVRESLTSFYKLLLHGRSVAFYRAKKIAIQEQIPETQFYLKSGPDV